MVGFISCRPSGSLSLNVAGSGTGFLSVKPREALILSNDSSSKDSMSSAPRERISDVSVMQAKWQIIVPISRWTDGISNVEHPGKTFWGIVSTQRSELGISAETFSSMDYYFSAWVKPEWQSSHRCGWNSYALGGEGGRHSIPDDKKFVSPWQNRHQEWCRRAWPTEGVWTWEFPWVNQYQNFCIHQWIPVEKVLLFSVTIKN